MNDYGTGHYAGSKVVLKSRTAQKNFQHHPSRIIAKRMLKGLKNNPLTHCSSMC